MNPFACLVFFFFCSLVYFLLCFAYKPSILLPTHSVFYIEKGCGASNALLRLLNLLVIWGFHGVSYTLIDMFILMNVRSAFLKLRKVLDSVRQYREAERQLRVLYPDATKEDLENADDNCAICREHMDSAKRLPCGHFFHQACLQQWMKYRSICPTCRYDLVAARPAAEANAPNNNDGVVLGANGGPLPPGAGGVRAPQPVQDGGANRLFQFNTRGWFNWLPQVAFEVRSGAHAGHGAHAQHMHHHHLHHQQHQQALLRQLLQVQQQQLQQQGQGQPNVELQQQHQHINNLVQAQQQNENNEENVAMLVEMFPSVPRDVVVDRLEQSASVEAAIDSLVAYNAELPNQ